MSRRFIHSFLKLICIAGLMSCRSVSNDASNHSTDVKQLSKFIALDYVPIHVMWQANEKKTRGDQLGPNDWSLLAILEYDESTIKDLEATVKDISPLSNIFVEPAFIVDWFPDPVKDSFVKEPNADYYLINVPVYPPDLFAKSPLLHGYFFIMPEENLVFLYLHTA